MSIDYDTAHNIAKRIVSTTSEDPKPKVTRFTSDNGFQFSFVTSRGEYLVSLDDDGTVISVTGLNQQRSQPPAGPQHPQSSERRSHKKWDDDDDEGKQAWGRNDDKYRQKEGGFPASSTPNGPCIDSQTAGKIALDAVEGRKVESIRFVGNGYEVTVQKGIMKKFVVQVDSNGKVVGTNRSKMTDMLDLELFD